MSWNVFALVLDAPCREELRRLCRNLYTPGDFDVASRAVGGGTPAVTPQPLSDPPHTAGYSYEWLRRTDTNLATLGTENHAIAVRQGGGKYKANQEARSCI